MTESKLKIGVRVGVVGKDATGTVSYIGTTQFSAGKWVGVSLDEPKGKNDGTVQGKRYFTCEENHGIFVRPTQLSLLEGDDSNLMSTSAASETSLTSDTGSTQSGAKRPDSKPPRSGSSSSLTSLPKQPKLSTGGTKPGDGTRSPQSPPERKSSEITKLGIQGSRSPTDGSRRSPKTSESNLAKISSSPKTSISPPVPPSPVIKSTPPTTTVVSGSTETVMQSADATVEVANLRAEVKTLIDQIDALRTKREEDRQKLQEFERLKIQSTQLEENRRLMREQSIEYQREITRLKEDKNEIRNMYDKYKDEMTDLAETMEMATLDKEMAEEKCESLTSELAALKEQVEELTLENQILKEEAVDKGGPSTDGAPTPHQVKNLEQQNERMKQALVQLRDITTQDKKEITSLKKEIGALEYEVGELTMARGGLEGELQMAQEQIIQLKDQVDAGLGADQMISQLTQKNLELEEKLEKLTEERNDLETLCEMNDEINENCRETERELREEIDQKRGEIERLARHMGALRESAVDYERTLIKFRDVVTELQAKNAELQRTIEGQRQMEEQKGSMQTLTQVPVDQLSMSGSFGLLAPSQTMAKMIEAELRRLESEYSNAHANRLTAFLPDSFVRRGGDNDALLTLLLIDRLAAKSNLLASHLAERYPLPACIPGQAKPPLVASDTQPANEDLTTIRLPGSTHPLPPMTKSKAEFYSFITCLIYLLRDWSTLMMQYKHFLNGCSVELYLKIGSLYVEMASHEQNLDHLIVLTRKDHLDENASLDPLLSSISYFQQLYSVHLSHEPVLDCSTKLLTFVQSVMAASDALSTSSTALLLLTGQDLTPLDQIATDASASIGGPVGLNSVISHTPAVASGDLISLIHELVRFATVIRCTARRIRRRVPNDPNTQPLHFSSEVVTKLDKSLESLTDLVSIFWGTTRKAEQLNTRQTSGSEDLQPSVIFKDCLAETCKECLSGRVISTGGQPDVQVLALLGQLREFIHQTAVAMENGEYDFDGTKQSQPQEPFSLRAVAYKQTQAELETSRSKLESKDEEIRELQMTLKARASELSEMAVRVGLADKRLETAGKGTEEKARLEQKLEQMEAQQKHKDREANDRIDALNAEIDSLEQEKRKLKEKLKELSKKALFEGLAKVPPSSSPTRPGAAFSPKDSPVEGSSTLSSPGRSADITLLNVEIQSLREAIRQLTADNSKLRGEKMMLQMRNLQPLKTIRRRPVQTDLVSQNEKENIPIPDKAQTIPDNLPKIHVRLGQIQEQIYSLMAHPKVIRLPIASKMESSGESDKVEPLRRSEPSATGQLMRQAGYLVQLKNELEQLRNQANQVIEDTYPQAFIHADFANFPSSRMKQSVTPTPHSDLDRLVARLSFPGSVETAEPTRLALPSADIRILHERLLCRC